MHDTSSQYPTTMSVRRPEVEQIEICELHHETRMHIVSTNPFQSFNLHDILIHASHQF